MTRILSSLILSFVICSACQAQGAEEQTASYNEANGAVIRLVLKPGQTSQYELSYPGERYFDASGIGYFQKNGVTCLGYAYGHCVTAYQAGCRTYLITGSFEELAGRCVEEKEHATEDSQTIIVGDHPEAHPTDFKVIVSSFDGEGNLIAISRLTGDGDTSEHYKLESGTINFALFMEQSEPDNFDVAGN